MTNSDSILQQIRIFRAARKARRKQLSKFRQLQSPQNAWTIAEHVDGAATHIEFGPHNLSMSVLSGAGALPEVRDHTALALAAISMSQNAHLTYTGPVSDQMAERLEKIARAYRLWSVPRLAPLRLTLTNVVAQDRREMPADPSGLICLSGGLDSFYAAVRAKQAGDVHHALLIAGLDYESDVAPGFVDLKSRVAGAAQAFGFEMLYARSDINRRGFAWSHMHGLNLGACLNLFADKFSFGVFAQDNTAIQDLHRHPWGNNGVLDQLISTTRFPIRTYGRSADRVDKLRTILEWDESVIQYLSVCYADNSTGGNCGHCDKCCQTRAAFEALGASDRGVFQTRPNLAQRFREMKVPDKMELTRGMMCRIAELADALPDGETRDAVVALEERLQIAFLQAGPVR